MALCDQWYLKYGDEDWKNKLKTHIKDPKKFWCFTETVQKEMEATVDWLKEWGCSRSFGLGTKLPWDQQYLIESLSDSTIYMSYYTVSHFLQGDLYGSVPGTLGIKPEELSLEAWDYVFLGKEFNPSIKVPEEKLKVIEISIEPLTLSLL